MECHIYLLHRVYTHMEKPQNTVRIMFTDFSSAFNTVRPLQLAEISVMQVDHDLVAWIRDPLTNSLHYVRPQGWMTRPLLVESQMTRRRSTEA